MKKLLSLALTITVVGFMTGCDKPAADAAKSDMKDAAKSAGDAVKSTADAAKDAVKK